MTTSQSVLCPIFCCWYCWGNIAGAHYECSMLFLTSVIDTVINRVARRFAPCLEPILSHSLPTVCPQLSSGPTMVWYCTRSFFPNDSCVSGWQWDGIGWDRMGWGMRRGGGEREMDRWYGNDGDDGMRSCWSQLWPSVAQCGLPQSPFPLRISLVSTLS